MPSEEAFEEAYSRLRAKRERLLASRLAGDHRRLLASYQSALTAGEKVAGKRAMAKFRAEITDHLHRDMLRSAKESASMVNARLPQKLRLTVDEEAKLAKSIGRFAERNAAKAGAAISRTNEKVMRRSHVIASQEAAKLKRKGVVMPKRNVHAIATAHAEANFTARVPQMAELHVGTAMEHGKVDATEVALGPNVIQARKRWDSKGDDKVRDSHLAADSQEVRVSEPFRVGSSLLMYPGDASLGAPIEERANCRCRAFFFPEQVERLRAARVAQQGLRSATKEAA